MTPAERKAEEARMVTVICVGLLLILCAFGFLLAEFASLAGLVMVFGIGLFGYGFVMFPSEKRSGKR